MRRCVAAGLAAMLAQACVGGPRAALQPCLVRAPEARACEALLTLRVALDPSDFEKHELAAVDEAAALWEAASGGAVGIELRAVDGFRREAVDAVIELGQVEPPAVALTRKGTRIILDRERIDAAGRLWTIVVAHELGHVMGLGHARDPEAIMAPNVTSAARMSSEDMKLLYEALGVR